MRQLHVLLTGVFIWLLFALPALAETGAVTIVSGGVQFPGGSVQTKASVLPTCGSGDILVSNSGSWYCGSIMIITNGVASCAQGVCAVNACASGYGDCDNSTATGCETNITTVQNCGACGKVCAANEACSGVPGVCAKIENWPPYTISPAWFTDLEYSFDGLYGTFHDNTYTAFLQNYTSTGDYLNYGKWKDFVNGGLILLDAEGIPQIVYGNLVYYNPVTVAQYALTMYGRYVNGNQAAYAKFFAAVDKLISLQSPDGSFRYTIDYQSKRALFPSGWVSAMAQGQVLSAFRRAIQLNDDPRYKTAGNLAFSFLMKPVSQGGLKTTLADLDPSLDGYLFFPEYPNVPSDYTLNGYMFTLLGVYDWAQMVSSSQDQARTAFASGIKTLEKILPYYNISGYSTYDLDHVTLGLKPNVPQYYQGVHILLLHALQSLVANPTIGLYEQIWTQKVDDMNSHVRLDSIKYSGTSPQPLGNTIAITLAASGGDPVPKLYQFYVKYNGVWTFDQPYSTNNIFNWTPKAAGHYDIGLYVKDQSSARAYDNFRAIPFEITAVSPAPAAASASKSKR